MFTGLVESMGQVQRAERLSTGVRFDIQTADGMGILAVGESIAVNGCCLTAIAAGGGRFSVEAGTETLSRTNLGSWAPGQRVNLERALRMGDRLGGHFVSGHIDCLGELVERRDEGDWSHFRVRLPPRWLPHLAAKGSIAVDGVSLTVVDVVHDTFSIALIPFTLSQTTLGQCAVGSRLNIETDLLAKYVETMLQVREES